MKNTMKLPNLDKAGIGKKFRIFIEIARHPKGMTITDVTNTFINGKFSKSSFASSKQGIWYHIEQLRGSGYITTEYENRNGHVALVCMATKSGVDMVSEEMCRLCKVMGAISKELPEKGDKKCARTE
jgi:hypothetical protein